MQRIRSSLALAAPLAALAFGYSRVQLSNCDAASAAVSGSTSKGPLPLPDCHVPACASKAEMFAKSLGGLRAGKKVEKSEAANASSSNNNSNSNNSSKSSESSTASSNGSSNSSSSNLNNNNKDNNSSNNTPTTKVSNEAPSTPVCPLDREELGRAAWSLIHTTAAFYPESPSEAEQAAARNLFLSLALLYPCHICADDLRRLILKMPPK